MENQAGGDEPKEVQETEHKSPKTKKAKGEKSDKTKSIEEDKSLPTKSTKSKSTKSAKPPQPNEAVQPRIKRGPARPHRRLAVEVIDLRIAKLQKRLDRTRSQIDDAARHVEGYLRERDFRAKEVV